jgi:dTDP-4-dehydrorhamnose reductase|tara:strand:+ start:129 stop:905 length:777 start_codon:yes stop_codon:yes gene_type:complete
MDKILIVGGDSLVGKSLILSWSNKNFEVHSTSRRVDDHENIYFDLEEPDFSKFSSHYSFIVFLAGNTNIQHCIDNPILSEKVNVHNLIVALNFFETICTNVLFLSSADVFDGSNPRESVYARHSPKNLYGHHKALVENFILEKSKIISILRLSKVIHSDFKLFLDWKKAVYKKEEIFPYSDKYFSPTQLTQVIDKINHIRLNNEIQIHHCSGDDDISYFNYALKYLECDPALITPIKDPSASKQNFYSSLQEDCCNNN